MIVSGEASGDMHGARLVRSMLNRDPDLVFCGMGGKELRAAGVEILYDAAGLAVVGITEVISHLGDILSARKALIRRMQMTHPALLILIDYPDFNLLLAAKAKQLGIPIFYYISPQVWAWRKGRTKKIGRLTDRIAVILPFEQEFYASYGIKVDFVGHPLVDGVHARVDRDGFLRQHDIPMNNTIIGLLPGSRSKEIRNLLPDFLRAAALLADRIDPDCTFLIPKASTVPLALLRENGLSQYEDRLDIRVIEENRYDLMGACEAVVAASGTVTLELAILGVPTVVTYRVSPKTYQLGRMLVRNVKYFSLVNLIAGQQIIPELLQDEVTPEAIAAKLEQQLIDRQHRKTLLNGLAEVRHRLGRGGASDRAADIALEIIASSGATAPLHPTHE
ncbi:MAG TPA: lipid-A-disaccharide synthase [Desulfobulbaceae bacterium]|nr:lipid-A-disaccharide synthase [Desulfobulbaceae bacterium]